MSLTIPVVWTDRHRLHEPGEGLWLGMPAPADELPARAERIRETLAEAGARIVDAKEYPEEPLLRAHDRALLEYLASAWEDWEAAGHTEDPGPHRVVPYMVPHPDLFSGFPPTLPAATSGRAGYFGYDTMTLIRPGTWEAARGAVDVALTATDLVLGGERAAYACCRPPGHHVTRASFGGSCYLNNSAIAAAHLREGLGAPIAMIDIDAHHGNGAQAIFWEDSELITASVHVDPGAGWFPHYLGFAGEQGGGAGAGANRNLPLAPGAGDEPWLEAVATLATWAHDGGARGLVVPLGVDAAAGDPDSPLEVTADGYREAGRILGALGLPTVVVQEGGYDLETIGPLVLAALEGVEEGLSSTG